MSTVYRSVSTPVWSGPSTLNPGWSLTPTLTLTHMWPQITLTLAQGIVVTALRLLTLNLNLDLNLNLNLVIELAIDLNLNPSRRVTYAGKQRKLAAASMQRSWAAF